MLSALTMNPWVACLVNGSRKNWMDRMTSYFKFSWLNNNAVWGQHKWTASAFCSVQRMLLHLDVRECEDEMGRLRRLAVDSCQRFCQLGKDSECVLGEWVQTAYR